MVWKCSFLFQCVLVQPFMSRTSWGFPRGKVNKDEMAFDCARREVSKLYKINLQCIQMHISHNYEFCVSRTYPFPFPPSPSPLLPHGKLFGLHPLSPLLRNNNLAPYFPLKTFALPSPSPLEFLSSFYEGGWVEGRCGYFLEPQIIWTLEVWLLVEQKHPFQNDKNLILKVVVLPVLVQFWHELDLHPILLYNNTGAHQGETLSPLIS